ncbi:MAG: hypothetical protein K2K80_03060 [Clostridia bacterium]|nr:hypothetical protein [Clostridia bacterium]
MAIFSLRLLSAVVIISLVIFGKLTEIEHVALSTQPVAIIYMVSVFLTIFLQMFTLWARIAFREKREKYDKRKQPSEVVGKKVKVDIDKSLQLPEEKEKKTPFQVFCGVVSGIKYENNQEQHTYVTGLDLPYNTFSGVVTAVVVRRDGSDVWVVVPENYKISDKAIKSRVEPYEPNASIDKIVR